MKVERRHVKNKTSNSCGLTVKTSLFKRHNFCSNFFFFIFTFIIFTIYNIIELPERLGSFFSKPGTSYAFSLTVFFYNSNFVRLNRDHKKINFTYKISFTEFLDVNKFRLSCEKVQDGMVEITH